MTAGRRDLVVERWTPFKHTILFEAIDLTGQACRLQVRASLDRTDAALIDLTNAASPAEGITLSVATVGGIVSTTVEIRINETTIEGLPFTSPRGGDWQGFWDIHIGNGVAKRRWLKGDFTVSAGVTQ
jgi:hypothetical protein